MTIRDQILGKPERIPLEVLIDKVVADLFHVFSGNGYKHVGFQLLVQNLEDNDMAGGGNLRPEGAETLLKNALSRVQEVLEEDKKPLPN